MKMSMIILEHTNITVNVCIHFNEMQIKRKYFREADDMGLKLEMTCALANEPVL